MSEAPHLSRRQVVLGGIVIAGLGACSDSTTRTSPGSPAETTIEVGAATRPAAEPDTQPGAAPPSAMSTPAAPTSSPSPSVAESMGNTSTGQSTSAPATPGALPSPPAPGQPALFVDHGSRDADMVSLTYHASGDPALTSALLDVLRASAVKVTVFAVGQWLVANPSLGQRIVADGHELANHTKTHKSMGTLDAATVATEIAGGGQALVPFIGTIGEWFRPSGIVVPTARILAAAGTIGYAYSIGYDLDTLDFQDPGAAAVLTNFQRGIRPGSIVSMHFGHQGTVDATPKLLKHLDSIGLRHVTLSELFAGV